MTGIAVSANEGWERGVSRENTDMAGTWQLLTGSMELAILRRALLSREADHPRLDGGPLVEGGDLVVGVVELLENLVLVLRKGEGGASACRERGPRAGRRNAPHR